MGSFAISLRKPIYPYKYASNKSNLHHKPNSTTYNNCDGRALSNKSTPMSPPYDDVVGDEN